MTFVAAIALLTLAGLAIRRVPAVAAMELPAQLAISFAAGLLMTGTLMFAYSLVGLPWTRVTLGIPILAMAVIGYRSSVVGRRRPADIRQPTTHGRSRTRAASIAITIFVLLTTYGVLTARETCADLMYFWGPKGQRFYRAEKIDVEFLKFPHYYLMHPDYPPLLPEVYAWGSLAGHRFSYWGALALTPLFLLATVLAFRGIAARKLGEELAGRYAVLMAAVLAYGFAAGMVAGAGDPPLLFFEVIALAAIAFDDDWKLAALGIAGAMFLKVEGTAFAAVLIASYLVTRRRVLIAAAPGIVLLGAWIAFAKHHDFLDAYGKSKSALHLNLIGKVTALTARQASYGAFYLPWLAALGPIALGRNRKRALLPLLAGLGVIAYTIYFYLHDADPAWWIASSAERVLLTALACFVVASAAASE